MERSNIIGGSNIFLCNGNPLQDQEFVNHVEDYKCIKEIKKQIDMRQSSVKLTPKQLELLRIEMRCALLTRPDPCWGYIDDIGVTSRCIKGDCPNISSCNPTYSEAQEEYWTMSEETKKLYGDPKKMKKYYLLDLESDQEMMNYVSDPKGAGMEFPHIYIPKPESESKQDNKQTIIGFERTYFGDADDELSPIYGMPDALSDETLLTSNRYGRYIKTVSVSGSKRDDQILLSEITDTLLKNRSSAKRTTIVLANEAELAYVSWYLTQAGVEHEVEMKFGPSKVDLWKADTKGIVVGDVLLVSSKQAKTKHIFGAGLVYELIIQGRDFFSFKTRYGDRWGCRNMYGATHLVVNATDISILGRVKETEIILLKSEKDYRVVTVSDNELIGTTNAPLWDALVKLDLNGEISGFPKEISGLFIVRYGGDFRIKGIGHMKFDAY